MKAILSNVTSAGTLANPFATIPAAIGSSDSITGDPGTHLYQLIQVGFAVRTPETTTVPFGGFEDTSVGSVVLRTRPEALHLFGDLAKDQPVPKSLLTGSAAEPSARTAALPRPGQPLE